MKHIEKFLGVENKAVDVYSKFTHKDFWEFINPENNFVYEIRMKNNFDDRKEWQFITELGHRLKVPFHYTGVFIQTAEQFYEVTKYCLKNHLTCYISANPKRKSIHSKTKKLCYNGEASADECIFSILLDFDSTKLAKLEFERPEERAYEVAKKFLEENPNIKKYIMICSGNGIQLRVPLDKIINLPSVEDSEFIVYQKLLKTSMIKLLNKYNTEYVTVDCTSLELARVGRAPFSVNFKNKDKPKYAGIVEIFNEGPNDGLTQFIIDNWKNAERSIVISDYYKDKKLLKEFEYDEDTIRLSKLVKLLLTDGIPEGGRNNILFFQFKLLCKANGLSLKSEKIQKLINEMRKIQHDAFPDNEPNSGMFNPNSVNSYCIDYNYPVCYPILYDRNKKRDININFRKIEYYPGETELEQGYNTINRLLTELDKNPIRFGSSLEVIDIGIFLSKIEKTYGKEKLDYFIDSGVLKQILEKI